MGDYTIETIRRWETRNFLVRVDAEEELELWDGDDDDGSVLEGLEDGSLVQFCAVCKVIHKPTGLELGRDVLGGCVYQSYEEFGNARRNSYLRDMVHEAITETRATLERLCASGNPKWRELVRRVDTTC